MNVDTRFIAYPPFCLADFDDFDGAETIQLHHVAEAVSYPTME